MTVDTIIEQAGIPLLLLVICVYYAIRLIVLHDSQAIRGKNKPPVKDEEAYCKAGGKLLLFFGAATFLMAILVFVNVYGVEAIAMLPFFGFRKFQNRDKVISRWLDRKKRNRK